MAFKQHTIAGGFSTRPHGYEAATGIAVGLAGAGIGGAMAGPPGAVVGLLIGGALGASAGWVAMLRGKIDTERETRRDREIGVIGGDLGAPGLQHPPSKIGAFSREASGAGSAAEPEQAEGPIQPPPGEG